jgi:hypothetical protein
MRREPIPRLPVFGWQALRGPAQAEVPCMLDLPGLHYSTSGRASILLALEALGVGPGDQVLVPTYHCPTMVAPASRLKAVPVFYPIDARGSPDLDWLERQDLKRARALLAAHYFGLPQRMQPLRDWCTARGIALVEDCAHALFGRSGTRPVGAWGDIAIGSLTKFLPVPEGGCLVVNRQAAVPALQATSLTAGVKSFVDILEVGASQQRLTGLNGLISGSLAGLRRLRTNPVAPAQPDAPALPTSLAGADASQLGADFTVDSGLAHRELAGPCRWVAQTLPRERIVLRRRRHFERLLATLGGQAGVHPLFTQLPPDCAPYVFPLWVDTPDPGYAELRRLAMPVFRWDRLWPGVPQLPGDHGVPWSHHVLQLACHQDLSEAQLDRFAAEILRLYGRR